MKTHTGKETILSNPESCHCETEFKKPDLEVKYHHFTINIMLKFQNKYQVTTDTI